MCQGRKLPPLKGLNYGKEVLFAAGVVITVSHFFSIFSRITSCLWANVISLPSLHKIKHDTSTMIVIKVIMIKELDAMKSVNLKKEEEIITL